MATTMRVLRLQGTVRLEDAQGNEKQLGNNMRLHDGNALNTAAESLVSVGLDDSKIITLQPLSRAEIRKRIRWLQLCLTRGGVFF